MKKGKPAILITRKTIFSLLFFFTCFKYFKPVNSSYIKGRKKGIEKFKWLCQKQREIKSTFLFIFLLLFFSLTKYFVIHFSLVCYLTKRHFLNTSPSFTEIKRKKKKEEPNFVFHSETSSLDSSNFFFKLKNFSQHGNWQAKKNLKTQNGELFLFPRKKIFPRDSPYPKSLVNFTQ